MRCNPGGQLALADIIGRDQLVKLLWETLEQQSVLMTAERRIGKTHVMKLLEEQPLDGWITIYADLEKIQTAQEFADLAYQTVQKHLPLLRRAANTAASAGKKLGGLEIEGIKLPEQKDIPWQEILQSAISTLMRAQDASSNRVLFLWDEVPYMLSNVVKSDGSNAAMQLLDILRSLRKDHPSFRVVITGSVGLHHVIDELNQDGYRNAPVNDMYDIDVEPLEQNYAETLAARLLAGEGVESNNPEHVAKMIAEQADCFPFYIHHVIKALKTRFRDQKVSADSVRDIVKAQLISDDDPWELRHYEKRLQDYYPSKHVVVKLVLDELATAADGLTARGLLDRIKQQRDFDDLDALRELLVRLNKDHYLKKSADGVYRFRFSLIQRWWCIHRELG